MTTDSTATPSLGPWIAVAPGVWRAVAEPDAVTIGLAVGTTGALLIDTGSSPEQGATIRAAAEQQARETADVPLIAVVVTHAHRDHLFGLAAFDDLRTIGHDSLGDTVRAEPVRSDVVAAGLDPDGLVLPNAPIATVAVVALGELRAEVVNCGRGHTDGDLSVLLPEADVVFVGDLAEQASPISYGTDSWPQEWAATLDGVIGLARPSTAIVVGHGEPISREDLIRTRSEAAAVAYEIESLIGRGVAVDQAYAEGNWPYPEQYVAGGIAADYARAEGRPVRAGRRSLPLA